MSTHQTFEAFIGRAQADLRRAYAGHLRPDMIPDAVGAAATYAEANERQVRRLANPVGYLYRVGRSRTRHRRQGFAPWETDADAPHVEPALLRALTQLPARAASAIWLVKACGWTNVQAAEALDVSPSSVATHAARGMERLGASLGSVMPDLDTQLRSLADHRLSLVPETATPPADDEEEEAQSTAAPARRRSRYLIAVALLPIVGVVAAMLISRSGDDTVSAVEPEPTPTPTTSAASTMYGRDIVDRDDWAQAIDELETPGTFVLAEVGTVGSIQTAVPDRAGEGFIPASTFDLLHALIILETGTLPDLDTVVPWDGVEREVPNWNQDHTLRTAIGGSAGWVFEGLGAQVGADAMAESVTAAAFGNADIGGSDGPFWLDGALRTTAIDQIAFLERLVIGDLPFDVDNQAGVVASLTRLDGPDSRISYKTGTTTSGDTPLAWLVGLVDTSDGQWVFAYNVDLPTADGEPQPISTGDRLAAVVDLLTSAGVLTD